MMKSWKPMSLIDLSENLESLELNGCHKLWFYNSYIFLTQHCRPEIFKTVKSAVISNNLGFKYQTCTPSSCKDVGIREFEC